MQHLMLQWLTMKRRVNASTLAAQQRCCACIHIILITYPGALELGC
jgi:hypothetical protein